MMNEEILTADDTEVKNEEEFISEATPSEEVSPLRSEEQNEPEPPLEADKDASSQEEPNEKNELTVEEMLNELKALKAELLEKRKAFEKMSRDIGEFEELFPEKKVNEIPDTVWESVKNGIPLAAAYALYERKNALRKASAKTTNETNSARTTGAIGREVTENFYTPDEVRVMSRSEVRKNYSKILESMKKWN